MKGDCAAFISLLREDHSLSMAHIGEECRVSQQYIDQVYRGLRPGGIELERSLAALYDRCMDGEVVASQKLYTWKAGKDVRRKGKQKSPSFQELLSRTRQAQATLPQVQSQPVSSPVKPQKEKPQCRHCQSTERLVRWFSARGGTWLCQFCAEGPWMLRWQDGKKRAER